MRAQFNLELVVKGEVRQPEKRLTMNKVNNVNTTEILLDIEQPTARDSYRIGEQGVVKAAVRHH